MPETKLMEDFEKARLRGVPLLAIETLDAAATIRQIVSKYKTSKYPIIKWDIAQGFAALTEEGQAPLAETTKLLASDPAYEYIKAGMNFPRDTIFIVLNGHKFMNGGSVDDTAFTQAVWNLRDKYKAGGQRRTFVMLCPQARLPEEIRQDFIILEDPLPTGDQLWAITKAIYEETKVAVPTDAVEKDRIIQTLKGSSAFLAEQNVALGLTKSGMDHERLWAQKRKQVEQTAGLSIYQGHETFADVVGCESIIDFFTMYMKGKEAPTEMVFMDEIEKMFAGIVGDNTGASQEQHGEFLRWMQDNRVPGIMLVGHPGCSKSFISKAVAGQFKRPMVELNISALKGSLLGQTGEQTRAAFKQIMAIGRPLMIATSNSLGILPPELKRRFKLGTWFFDLPNREQKDATWRLYQKKFNLQEHDHPDDEGWTPSEIEVCVELADSLGSSLLKASKFIVPVSKSDPTKIEALRRMAHRRFNDANHEGTYEHTRYDWLEKEEKAREIVLGPGVGQA